MECAVLGVGIWITFPILFQPITKQQELSYRKQIARQLRTQYIEGINSNPVTLEMWVRGHSSSLNMVPFESLRTVSYSSSIV